jgi:hypothetical protein
LALKGTITGRKSVWTYHRRDYWVYYEFEGPGGELLRDRMSVSTRDYNRDSKGKSVTILMDPEDPKWNLIYEYCDYEWVGLVAD